MKRSLIVIRGLPGSGKNTFAELFNAPVCCADDYLYNEDGEYIWTVPRVQRAHMICQSKCKRLLQDGEPLVFVANTNIKARDVKGYTKMGDQYGYKVFSIIVENRTNNKNVHNVPDETVEKMRKNFHISL